MKTYILPILLVLSHQMIAVNQGSESSTEYSSSPEETCTIFTLSRACQATIPQGTRFSITIEHRQVGQRLQGIGKGSASTRSQEELLLAVFESVQDQLPEDTIFSIKIDEDKLRCYDGEVEMELHGEVQPFR